MGESGSLRRLRTIFGSDGPWLLIVLSIVGVIGSFAAFGWVGLAVLIVLILVLLVIVFAKAALRPRAESKEQSPMAPPPEEVGIETSLTNSGGSSSDRPPPPGEGPTSVEDTDSSDDSHESSAFHRGVKGLIEHDFEQAATALDEWIAEASDPMERLERQGIKFSALVRAGDSGAMARLRDLADDNTRNANLQAMYLRTLAENGWPHFRIDQVPDRLEAIGDPDGRAILRLAEARMRLELGEVHRAKSIGSELLESQAAFGAATMLAEIAATEGEHLLEIAYYERALSTNPTEADIRFKVAYAASQAGMPMLAVHHYRLLEASSAAKGVTINNLGVALEKGGARSLARDYWRRASKMGSALASGNLANAAARAGFLEEAEGFIKAASTEDESPRVGEALQRIATTRESDLEIRKEMEEGGKTVSAALARLILKPAPSLPIGEWEIDGKDWTFESRESTSQATRDPGGKCEFFLDAGNRLRFELRASTYSSAVSGYAVQVGESEDLLLVAAATGETREHLIKGRPSA